MPLIDGPCLAQVIEQQASAATVDAGKPMCLGCVTCACWSLGISGHQQCFFRLDTRP